MKDVNKILTIVLIIISVLVLYLVFTGNKNIREAQKQIREVKTELTHVNDSIGKAQDNLKDVIEKLDFAEKELMFNKVERDMLMLQEERAKAATWDTLQIIKEAQRKKLAQRQILLDELKKYEN